MNFYESFSTASHKFRDLYSADWTCRLSELERQFRLQQIYTYTKFNRPVAYDFSCHFVLFWLSVVYYDHA